MVCVYLMQMLHLRAVTAFKSELRILILRSVTRRRNASAHSRCHDMFVVLVAGFDTWCWRHDLNEEGIRMHLNKWCEWIVGWVVTSSRETECEVTGHVEAKRSAGIPLAVKWLNGPFARIRLYIFHSFCLGGVMGNSRIRCTLSDQHYCNWVGFYRLSGSCGKNRKTIIVIRDSKDKKGPLTVFFQCVVN